MHCLSTKCRKGFRIRENEYCIQSLLGRKRLPTHRKVPEMMDTPPIKSDTLLVEDRTGNHHALLNVLKRCGVANLPTNLKSTTEIDRLFPAVYKSETRYSQYEAKKDALSKG